MTSSERGNLAGASGGGEDVRRLHPWTLALRLAVSIPAMLFLLLPFFRNPDSAAVFNLATAILYAAIVFPWLVAHYLRFRYRITPTEIQVESGVLTRRRRSIPIDRIQNVEIEQRLLQRITGTARVRIHTAGSEKAEGSFEVVALDEAERIRAAVRAYQGAAKRGEPEGGRGRVTDGRGDADQAPGSAREDADGRFDADAPPGSGGAGIVGRLDSDAREPADRSTERDEGTHLFAMDLPLVLLSGTFRFSMLYVALAFSALQYWEDDPVMLVTLLLRGPLSGVAQVMAASPWIAAAAGAAAAVLIGWLSGIVVNANRWYRFTLTVEGGKLHASHGLLSTRRTTIPLRRVQMLIVRTNPLMRRFGWYTLQVQTMGFDVREQGHAVVVPFAGLDVVRQVAETIRTGMPDRGGRFVWPELVTRVSKLTIRRAFVRYALFVAAASAASAWWLWDGGWYGLLLLPAAFAASVVRWRRMGFLLDGDHLVVRRGVLGQQTWIMPIGRTQVVYTRASFFQRRLGLATVYVDTAGASPVSGPDIVDLERGVADRVAAEVYARFAARAA